MLSKLRRLAVKKHKVLLAMRWPAAVAVLGFGATMAFQNCAEPLSLSPQDAASYYDTLPFAYDTQADTISYMSCNGFRETDSPRAFFSFRVGAYGEGSGVGLSQAFAESTERFSDAEQALALSKSDLNKGAMLQLSIRRSQQYQTPLQNPNNSWKHNFDFYNYLMPLDSPEIAETLAALGPGERKRFFSGYGGLDNHKVEGSLRFPGNRNIGDIDNEDAFRGVVREGVLAMAYTIVDPTSTLIRSPDPEDPAVAYGRGYKIGFRKGFGIRNEDNQKVYFSSAENRAIEVEREFSLQDPYGAGLGQWDCSNDDTYIVIRPQDATPNAEGVVRAYCNLETENPANFTEEERAKLERIRRVLRVEDWYVDVRRNCVVPKTDSGRCYPKAENEEEPIVVNYFGGNCSGDGCPHYVTVCTRRQNSF